MTNNTGLSGPEWMFRSFTLPNYREYIGDELSVRRAYNAAVSLSHMADHIAVRSSPRLKARSVRQALVNRNSAFRMVDAMCNAFKHVHATGGGQVNRIVATTSGMSSVGPEVLLFEGEVDGRTRKFRTTRQILVFDYFEAKGKRSVWVATTLYGAIRFLAQEIGCDADLTNADLPAQHDFVYN